MAATRTAPEENNEGDDDEVDNVESLHHSEHLMYATLEPEHSNVPQLFVQQTELSSGPISSTASSLAPNSLLGEDLTPDFLSGSTNNGTIPFGL
jgi:hypothetical protein